MKAWKRMKMLTAALMVLCLGLGGALAEEDGGAQCFRPVDCGVMTQEVYEYPFMGMTIRLSETMLEKMDSREVFVAPREDYEDDLSIRYALWRFSATTQAQREEEVTSVDIYSWEEELEKFGALGVYRVGLSQELDELTGCDTHRKLGESADGCYEYYLSLCTEGDQALAAELELAEVELTDMRPIDIENFTGAFSAGRVEGVTQVGSFETLDVFGRTCSQELFCEYDLTLVNAFTTWCGPCREELPDLEKLRQSCEEKGIRLGVVGAVIDTIKPDGSIDEGAVEEARAMGEENNLQFPLLIPDEGNMNGRLKGLESFPESFFVDAQGNIVGETYSGARSFEEWEKIVQTEIEALKAAK